MKNGPTLAALRKLPEITLLFWIMKICATTLGETAGDLLSMTLSIGYAASSILLVTVFLLTLGIQLVSRVYIPSLYWLVILSTSTAGTTISDYMDRTLELGYAKGSAVLMLALCGVLAAWRLTTRTLSIANIRDRRSEVFYWSAILISNTLGTALGDFLADDSGLGFFGGALLIATLIATIAILYYTTRLSHTALFWCAFILTRPLGATVGDLLTKSGEKGGFDFGTIGSSAVLFVVLAICVFYSSGNPTSDHMEKTVTE